MEFKTFEEAQAALRNGYSNLHGVIDPISNKKNWALFVGTNDPIMSSLIYQGVREHLPNHHFTEQDLRSIEFWTGYFDESILPINTISQDDYLRSICKPNGLYHRIVITEEWTEPIRIPKGLGFRMKFTDDKEIWYDIFDPKNSEKSESHKMGYYENFQRLFRYDNVTVLHDMEKPSIKFKLDDNRDSSEIYLLFVNE